MLACKNNRILTAALVSVALLATAPCAANAQSPSARDCLARAAGALDQSSEAARDKSIMAWMDACRQALAATPQDTRLKVALAHAVWLKDGRPAALVLLREAAAQNDTQALLAIFNDFNSFDRNLNRPDLIPRAEAEQALRRAAELGDPEAIWRLATILTRGGPFKHDLAAARMWGERAIANPPKDMRANDLQVLVGNWLAESDDAGERARGIAMLVPHAKAGRGDAQADLAQAIRASDPVRARALLESAVRTYPGHALAPLADMLIKGEGGPKDEKRALSILQSWRASDAQHAKAKLGEIILEGRLLPRDVAKAVKLLGPWSQWDYDTRLVIRRLLAENPQVRLDYPDHFLYTATEDAELGEPRAMDALITLKLSGHAQFGDKAGGCTLAERAAKAGNAEAARRLSECRAN